MIRIRHKGDFSKTAKFFEKGKRGVELSILDKYGKDGVAALASATPVDSGKTASSWYYTISSKGSSKILTFSNRNVNKGVKIAIILQYGHGTRNGGYVQGRDYINPAIRPVMDELADKAWKEVANA